MVRVREILCPTDFSEASRHALEHAVMLAKWYDSQITALHVIYVPLVRQPPIFGAAFVDMAQEADSNVCRYDEALNRWLKPAQQAGIRTEIVVDAGDPARMILERARSRRADLIVMGTHGLSGFERFMLGSVSERVLRRADCPVMTVPPAAEAPGTGRAPYKQLLCPVDFSQPSLSALQFAFSLAEESRARLTILHVFDWPPDDELVVEQFDATQFRRVVEQQLRARLDALVTEDARQWCTPATSVAYGKPYREILDLAANEAADLIVMGVHGRNPLDLTLFGSTTNQVVRRASCPVLTLRQ